MVLTKNKSLTKPGKTVTKSRCECEDLAVGVEAVDSFTSVQPGSSELPVTEL